MEHTVITNLNKWMPEIIVVGTAGARDLLLFECTELHKRSYHSLMNSVGEVYKDRDMREFLKVRRLWGGAVHYFLQGIEPQSELKIALCAVVSDSTNVKGLLEELENLQVGYYLVVIHDTRKPAYYGIMFEDGDRYWSNKYIELGVAGQLSPICFPVDYRSAALPLFTTQPIKSLAQFISLPEIKQCGVQLFENDLVKLKADSELRAEIWTMLRQKCVLLNLNEAELLIVGRIFFDMDTKSIETAAPLDIARFVDNIVDELATNIPGCLIAVGLGEIGALISYRGQHRSVKLVARAFELPGAFGIGAGDIAWAGLVSEIAKECSNDRNGMADLKRTFEQWEPESFHRALQNFVLNGALGAFSPNIFHMTAETKKRLTESMERKVGMQGLMVFASVHELFLDKINQDKAISWKPNTSVSRKGVAVQEWDNLILAAYQEELSNL